jgi:hypothetical protein
MSSAVKRSKRTTYLIAARQHLEAVCVYAAIAEMPDAAVAQVRASMPQGTQVEIVGGLSRDMTRRLGLKAGELLLL